MKTSIFLTIIFTFFSMIQFAQSQTLFYEDFNYAIGDSLNGKTNGQGLGNWEVSNDDGTPMYVNSSGLTFPNYSNVAGNAATIIGGSGKDALFHEFTSSPTNNIYFSFLVSISNNNNPGGVFTAITNSNGGNFRSWVYVKVNNSIVNFGLKGAGAGVPTYGKTNFQPNTTYLCVVKYTIINGKDNDSTSLYVFKNSDNYSIEPTNAEVRNQLVTGEYQMTVKGIILYPDGYTSPNALSGVTITIDGIRVGSKWINAPLPVKEESILPKEYVLQQNHPNPFNPATTIEYTIPTQTHVTLKIYDVLGKEIKTLVNETQSAGKKSISWDGKDNNNNGVSTGIYFYKLSTTTNTEVKKMVLMK